MAQYVISTCDDGGYYYITQYIAVGEDTTVVWVGLSEDGRFGNVFWGRYARDSQLLEEISGEWWDIPFGTAARHGTLQIHVGTSSARRTGQTGGFGGEHWESLQAAEIRRPIEHYVPLTTPPGDTGEGLSGYWRSATTGSRYYITQVGDTVVWFAADESRNAANVFKGTRSGNIVSGQWVDVCYGQTRNRGRVSFRIVSDEGEELLPFVSNRQRQRMVRAP